MSIFARFSKKLDLPTAEEALPGRSERIPVPASHFVLGVPIAPPFPEGTGRIVVGMGCFWGAERKYWQADGIYTSAVGYAAGLTPNPTYEEVCSGRTGHNEVVLAVFEESKTSYEAMLQLFWENHDPTQGMRQGNDVGTQYRSGIYVFDDHQKQLAEASLKRYQSALDGAGYSQITTEILPLDFDDFYYAEHYHQQYLAKVPDGYCGIGGTGVSCPSGLSV